MRLNNMGRTFANFENRKLILAVNVIFLSILPIIFIVVPFTNSLDDHGRIFILLIALINTFLLIKRPKSVIPYFFCSFISVLPTFILSMEDLPSQHMNLVHLTRTFIFLFLSTISLKPKISWLPSLIILSPLVYLLNQADYTITFDLTKTSLVQVTTQFIAAFFILIFWEINRSGNQIIHTKRISKILSQLNNKRKEYLELNGFKNKLINKTSQDIRTPLNIIYSEIQSFENGQYFNSDLLKEKITDLIDLVDNVIELNSDKKTIQPINPFWVSHEEIKSCFTITGNSNLDSDHMFQIVSLKENVHYFLDFHILKLGLKPLIKNAMVHTKRGQIQLEIFSMRISETLTEISFVLQDQGQEMPPKQIKTLFEEASFDNNGPRVADGISIAYHNLIERLGAQWEIGQNDHFRGLKIEVKLKVPYKIFENSVLEKLGDSLKSKSILIVDDIKMNAKVLERIISPLGMNTTRVYTGSDAVKLCQSNHYDYVLMDLHMPEVDGYEASTQIINSGFTGSIIAVTAEKGINTIPKALGIGIKGVVFKPVSLNQIKQSLITHSPLH